MRKFYSIFFLLFGSILFCQNSSIPIAKIMDVDFINERGISVISSDSVLHSLNISDENKKSISESIDFNNSQLLYLSFPYSCPSMCNETFFEYNLKNENQSSILYILIHSVGGLAARKYKSVFLEIKNTAVLNGLTVEKKYPEYTFQTKNQLDSICNNLYKKFNK